MRSRPARTRGEPDAWRHARPVRRRGSGKRIRGEADTAPRPDPYETLDDARRGIGGYVDRYHHRCTAGSTTAPRRGAPDLGGWTTTENRGLTCQRREGAGHRRGDHRPARLLSHRKPERSQERAKLRPRPSRRNLRPDLTYFSGYMNENLIAVQGAVQFTRDEMLQLARNAFTVSRLAENDKDRYLDALNEYAAKPA
jgi:hypothetical protein